MVSLVLLLEDSAATEPAWKGAGQKEGIRIWRIVVGYNIQSLYHIAVLDDDVEIMVSLDHLK